MSETTSPATGGIDPAALFDDPYAVYGRLREEGPVHRITGTDGLPAWLVTRYDDVRQALGDRRLSLDKRHAPPGGYRGMALPPALDANLLNMDPPDHTRIRRLVSRAFTPRHIEELREPVRRTAELLLDACAGEEEFDLIAAYAAPLPITVICDLLRIPGDNRYDFRAWTDALMAPDPTRPARARDAVGRLLAFFTGLVADRRRHPGDDLLSALIAVRDEEDRLSEDELMSLAFLILVAGYENTVHLIGNAVAALLAHPAQLAALRADPALLDGAVEELAR
jgi:cytochrome P450